MIINVPKSQEVIFNRIAAAVEKLIEAEGTESVLELIDKIEEELDAVEALIGTGEIT